MKHVQLYCGKLRTARAKNTYVRQLDEVDYRNIYRAKIKPTGKRTFAQNVLFIYLLVLLLGIAMIFFANLKASAAESVLTPAQEETVINSVAVKYKLSRDQTVLLKAIRRHEAGRPGKEFGVETARAMRYQDGVKSFRIQAEWAAGTIKKHTNYKITWPMLFAFGRGYGDYLGYSEDIGWARKVWMHMDYYMAKTYRNGKLGVAQAVMWVPYELTVDDIERIK